MKGISFQNGVEFKLTISGESWAQGTEISGELVATAKNPGASVEPLRVILAETTERKLKSKSPEAFHVIEELTSKNSPLPWTFKLTDRNRITDSAGGLCVLYGNQTDMHAMGILKLSILPHPYLHDLIELIRTEFRFALKKLSAGKQEMTEAKFEPSGSKEWASLEEMIFDAQVNDETIDVNFVFHKNSVEGKKKPEISRSWPIAEIVHDFNNRLNKDAATVAIQNVFTEYGSGGWLA